MPFAIVNGTPIEYADQGRGRPVVFVPPPLVGRSTFDAVMERLPQGIRGLSMQLRGHGHSGKSPVPYTYREAAEDVRGVLDHAEVDKAIVCGYSMGTGVALQFLLDHPDRCLGAVLVGAFAGIRGLLLRFEIGAAAALSSFGGQPLVSAVVAAANALSLSQFTQFLSVSWSSMGHEVRDLFANARTFDCEAQLKGIQLPITLVYGMKDPMRHPYGDVLLAQLPNRILVEVPGVGHQVPPKRPEELVKVLTAFETERRPGE